MLPKIEAAVSYLAVNPTGQVLITSLDCVAAALKGKAGTVITA
jgi:carbamate kinase